MRLRRSRRFSRLDDRARTAIISDAVTMSKPDSRIGAFGEPPIPETTVRSALSSTSVTRRQVMPLGLNPGICPRCATLSVNAARRLCAEPTACASPVKWIFTSSCGSTRDRPPPVPPPLIPNIGPSDGSRNVATTFFPNLPNPCAMPTVVVVLPSPAGVGVIPVTTISLPRLPSLRSALSGIFALKCPCGMRVCVSSPSSAATSIIGRMSLCSYFGNSINQLFI